MWQLFACQFGVELSSFICPSVQLPGRSTDDSDTKGGRFPCPYTVFILCVRRISQLQQHVWLWPVGTCMIDRDGWIIERKPQSELKQWSGRDAAIDNLTMTCMVTGWYTRSQQVSTYTIHLFIWPIQIHCPIHHYQKSALCRVSSGLSGSSLPSAK
jgi:hypothetical protein